MTIDAIDSEPAVDAQFLAFQEKVKGSNIDPETLLATDYLNHFNEVVMLIEMLPDMPDCLDMVQEWRPKTYQEHFRDSTFSDKQLAIDAYEHVPKRYRDAFEKNTARMNALVEATTEWLEQAIKSDDQEKLRAIASRSAAGLRKLTDVASAIIHGSEATLEQSEIDAILGD